MFFKIRKRLALKESFKNIGEKIWGWTHDVRAHPQFKHVRRLVITLFGLTILLIGIAMIILPGPALIVIPLSFAILGTEYVWARKIFEKMKKQTDKITSKIPIIRKKSADRK